VEIVTIEAEIEVETDETTEAEIAAVAAVEIVTIEVENAVEIVTTEAETVEKVETTTDHLAENTRVAMTEGRNAVVLENPVDGDPRTSVGRVVAEIRRGVFI